MPDPDLMIRTSGEYRISNFLLWEIAYSELVFTDVLWPDFRREHLFDAVREYQDRERRFGGVDGGLERAGCCYRDDGHRAAHLQAGRGRPHRRASCTGGHGKVRAVAKGVRKTKSKFGVAPRADEPRRPAALRGPRARHRHPGRVDRPLPGDPRRPRPHRPGVGHARGGRPAGAGARGEPAALPDAARGAPDARRRRTARWCVPAFFWKLLALEGYRPDASTGASSAAREDDARGLRPRVAAACCARRAAGARRCRPRRSSCCSGSSAVGSAPRWTSPSRRPPTRSTTWPPGRRAPPRAAPALGHAARPRLTPTDSADRADAVVGSVVSRSASTAGLASSYCSQRWPVGSHWM